MAVGSHVYMSAAHWLKWFYRLTYKLSLRCRIKHLLSACKGIALGPWDLTDLHSNRSNPEGVYRLTPPLPVPPAPSRPPGPSPPPPKTHTNRSPLAHTPRAQWFFMELVLGFDASFGERCLHASPVSPVATALPSATYCAQSKNYHLWLL